MEELNVNKIATSKTVYKNAAIDIFLNRKNSYCPVFRYISAGGNIYFNELKNRRKNVIRISNISRNIAILSANLAFASDKKVIPNIEYSRIKIIKIDKKESVLIIS